MSLPAENPEVPSKRNKTGPRVIIFVRNVDRLLELAGKTGRTYGTEAKIFPWRHGVLSAVFCKMKKIQEVAASKEGWDNLYKGRNRI
ncbi:MAG: hypothetical protein ACTSPY_13055 [Candidatus Helarchaeota archaeon]